jgi:hypothetical protein
MKIKIPQKMKKSVYKSATLLLAGLILLASGLSAQQEVSKEYHKEYTAKKGVTLDLNNKYGNIVVATSENDNVVINVKVTVRYPNREKAEKLLSYIDVKFDESPGSISAETVIDSKFNFTGWSGESRKFMINYNVEMPVGMDLTLANRYGNTELEDLDGLVNIDIKYGNLTAEKFSRGNEKPLNRLELAYGKGTIEEAGWMDLVIRYCGNLTIEKGQALLLDSKYSKFVLGTISSLVAESKYDNIRIEDINNLILDTGYADINIEALNKKLKFDGSYSSLNVERIPKGFESVEVNSRYTGVRLGIDESASYKLDGKVSYGGLKFNEDSFSYKQRIIQNNSTEVTGTVGKDESTASTVKIQASYGTVKLY